eukprot:6180647-Prymnesium_polylepis.1
MSARRLVRQPTLAEGTVVAAVHASAATAAATSGAAATAAVDLRKVRATFNKFDRDRSGGIVASELRPALKELGIEAGLTETRAILTRYDDNTNRALSLPEFESLIKDITALRWQSEHGGDAGQQQPGFA